MIEPEYPCDLAFVHLSDIHFRKGHTGDAHDEDSDLRLELVKDLRSIGPKVPAISGIIVSGDIAFGGDPEEYAYAAGWLESVREMLNCSKTKGIMVTPGNHDVDRAKILAGGDIEKMHDEVRAARSLADRDAALNAILRDAAKGTQLFEPMEAYNAFAKEYGCDVTPQMPYWERDFPLGNKGTLRIRGLTSTLISDEKDDENTGKLFYGPGQRMLHDLEGIQRMVVGHHPPSWAEGDDADQAFILRAALQLFGHKHKQWPVRAGNGLRIIAGAVHPSRKEKQWEPRYNVIALRLDVEGQLHARVYPRRWSEEFRTFIGDCDRGNRDYRDYTVKAG